jgi:hypothetical protein
MMGSSICWNMITIFPRINSTLHPCHKPSREINNKREQIQKINGLPFYILPRGKSLYWTSGGISELFGE